VRPDADKKFAKRRCAIRGAGRSIALAAERGAVTDTAVQTRLDRFYLPGLFALTLSTGVVDAVSFIALDRVFTGNMTGNVLFIGFGLAGVGGIPLLNNLIALVGFLVGAVVASRIVRGHTHHSRLPTVNLVVLTVSALLAVTVAIGWMSLGTLPPPALLVVTALLAAVMGAQAAGVRAAGISDVTTIVVTSTLANFAIESRLAGGPGDKWRRRLIAVLAMGVGGVLGALLIRAGGGAPAMLFAALVMLLAVALLNGARRREAVVRAADLPPAP
jgi:uncharacterized membrane protein YoaK (UPF0700 family)